MQREVEPRHLSICCKQLLASKQSESYSSLLKDPKILKVFAELFPKSDSPKARILPDKSKFEKEKRLGGVSFLY